MLVWLKGEMGMVSGYTSAPPQHRVSSSANAIQKHLLMPLMGERKAERYTCILPSGIPTNLQIVICLKFVALDLWRGWPARLYYYYISIIWARFSPKNEGLGDFVRGGYHFCLKSMCTDSCHMQRRQEDKNQKFILSQLSTIIILCMLKL